MHKSLLVGFLTVSAATIAIGCRDTAGPLGRPLLVPAPRTSNTVAGPPDFTVSVPANAWPSGRSYLTTFPWDTWVTLESPGTVQLIALPRLPNGSSAYVEGGPVPATGKIDLHPDGVCVLNLSVADNYGNLTSWGPCGAQPKIDTVLSKKLLSPWVMRGPLPVKHYYECSNTTDLCHSVSSSDASSVEERPVPVTLSKLKASKHTSTFVSPESITFTASKTPDSVHVGGGTFLHPMAITLWEWTGADSTRNPNPAWTTPCHSNSTVTCTYLAYESGRMVVKAFVGGWEQTSSVTVQCLLTGEPALNDSTHDFSVREDLLNVLVTSNADSAAGAGWTGQGWDRTKSRHESGGVIWLLPDGGGYVFVPYEDPTSTAVRYYLPDSTWSNAAAPVPGAVPYAPAHDHPTRAGTIAYGWPGTTTLPNGVVAHWAQYPLDTIPNGALAPVAKKAKEDSATWRGDSPDRAKVAHQQMPEFQITNGGFVWRLNYPQTDPPTATPFRPSGGTESQRKCAWPKKYRG